MILRSGRATGPPFLVPAEIYSDLIFDPSECLFEVFLFQFRIVLGGHAAGDERPRLL